MKNHAKIEYAYNLDTVKEASKLDPKTVSGNAHLMGIRQGEPLIVMMDCLSKYACSYRNRFQSHLSDDYVLGVQWLTAAKAIRQLLNSDGAVAMDREITTDSKDNGAVEAMFWTAMENAGFSQSDI